MSDLSKESLVALSKLCRIELSEDELVELSEKLKNVLDYAELLQEVDVSDLAPYSHVDEQGISSLREDKAGEHLPRDTFLSNAPDQVGGMIRVPPVMKQSP